MFFWVWGGCKVVRDGGRIVLRVWDCGSGGVYLGLLDRGGGCFGERFFVLNMGGGGWVLMIFGGRIF